jgi:hypothetical protein
VLQLTPPWGRRNRGDHTPAGLPTDRRTNVGSVPVRQQDRPLNRSPNATFAFGGAFARPLNPTSLVSKAPSVRSSWTLHRISHERRSLSKTPMGSAPRMGRTVRDLAFDQQLRELPSLRLALEMSSGGRASLCRQFATERGSQGSRRTDWRSIYRRCPPFRSAYPWESRWICRRGIRLARRWLCRTLSVQAVHLSVSLGLKLL